MHPFSLCSKSTGWKASVCLEILDKNPTAAPWNHGQLLHQGLPCSPGLLWGQILQEPLVLCPSVFRLGLRAYRNLPLWKCSCWLWGRPLCIQAPFLIILSLVCFHHPQLHPFPTGPSVWMYLSGRIIIVPLRVFPPSLRYEQPLQSPNNPHPCACCIPIAGLLPGGTCRNLMVSKPYPWCAKPPLSAGREERQPQAGKQREKTLCWLETVSDPFLVFYVLSAVCVVQCMLAPVDRFAVHECCRLLLDC